LAAAKALMSRLYVTRSGVGGETREGRRGADVKEEEEEDEKEEEEEEEEEDFFPPILPPSFINWSTLRAWSLLSAFM